MVWRLTEGFFSATFVTGRTGWKYQICLNCLHEKTQPVWEAYPVPTQTSKMEFSAKITAVNHFVKELHLRYLTGFRRRFCVELEERPFDSCFKLSWGSLSPKLLFFYFKNRIMGSILFLTVNITGILIKIVTRYLKKLCRTLSFIIIELFVIYLPSGSVFQHHQSMCICKIAQRVFTWTKSKMEPPKYLYC